MLKLWKKLLGSWGRRREEKPVLVLAGWLVPGLLWLQLRWKLQR